MTCRSPGVPKPLHNNIDVTCLFKPSFSHEYTLGFSRDCRAFDNVTLTANGTCACVILGFKFSQFILQLNNNNKKTQPELKKRQRT